VRWLLARRVGRAEADRFLEELDELHRLKVQAKGVDAGDRWLRRELRMALFNGLGPRKKESAGESRGDGRRPAPAAWTPDLLRDLRFGLRTLRRRPLFAFLVVGTLGLGIGASTTVFSLVDGILLKDMAYERPQELVEIWGTWPGWREDPLLQEAWDKIGLTWDGYTTLRDQTQAFSGIAGHRSGILTLTGAGDPVRLESGEATATLFPLLGIRPLLGRSFLPGEEGPGAPRLAVLGYELWQTRFGSDSTVVGRSVTLNGQPFEVIGVLPRGVRIHSTLYNLFNSAIDAGERAVWVPANWSRRTGDGSREEVVVINETMARRFWPGASPLGDIVGNGPDPYRIVGVVGDVRERHLAEEPLPMVYHPASTSAGDFSFVARTSGDPEALVPLLREAVMAVEPGIPLTQATTVKSLVAESSGAERFRAFLVTGFGLLATLLALVGVFGVTARKVAHRTREMGIRMALGAESGGLIRMMALGTLRAGAVGIGLGLFGAFWVTKLLTAFLFGTRPWDGGTYGAAALLLGLLCAAAATMAARRVTRVEPMRVLREE
jgi:hypothetical protein